MYVCVMCTVYERGVCLYNIMRKCVLSFDVGVPSYDVGNPCSSPTNSHLLYRAIWESDEQGRKGEKGDVFTSKFSVTWPGPLVSDVSLFPAQSHTLYRKRWRLWYRTKTVDELIATQTECTEAGLGRPWHQPATERAPEK